MLKRDDILGISDIQREEVQVPEWGGSVFVQGLSGKDRDKYQTSLMDKNNKVSLENATIKLVLLCTVDENGEKLFEMADMDILNKKSAKALGRIYDVAMRLCGFTEKDIDDLTKN